MDEDEAGSWPNDCNTMGMIAPEKPATVIDNIIEIPITKASPAEDG